jgi:hypothetical protein
VSQITSAALSNLEGTKERDFVARSAAAHENKSNGKASEQRTTESATRDAPEAANVFTRFVIAWESDRQRWSKSAEARRACPLWPPRNCWKLTPARV